MKIIDEFYLITISIIIIGLPTLFYLKINQPDSYNYNIVIYGDTIDASMLAYEIDRSIKQEGLTQSNIVHFNITLISPPQQTTSEIQQQREQIDKKVISFCGVEEEWMTFLGESKLKYYINEYGIYFGETILGSQRNEFSIYSIQSSFLSSLAAYGLSNYAAKDFFKKFASKISKNSKIQIKYSLDELSISRIVRSVFPSDIADGLNYFSQKLGLDQDYIEKFILPVILGNYLHEASSLSTLYKLLPVYCHNKPEIGQSLVLFEYPHKIREKLLLQIVNAKVNRINNKRLETYSLMKDAYNQKKKYVNVILTQKTVISQEESKPLIQNDTSRVYIKGDTFFIFQNIDSNSAGKQFSYYKTIIDGKIKNDHLYEQFFTIYLKGTSRKKEQAKSQENKKEKSESKASTKNVFNPIYSITRICAYNCKGYENSVYVLVSKHKLSSSKTLNMFQSHNIVYFKKYFMQQSQLPTTKKLQQNQNVYKIYDIDSISDSYQLQLQLVRQISKAFIRKIKREYFQ